MHEKLPIMINEKQSIGNTWNAEFRQGLYNLTTDSKLFKTHSDFRDFNEIANGNVVVDDGGRYLPMYEAKMMHLYDHRLGGYPLGQTSDTRALPKPTDIEKASVYWEPMPRYWVSSAHVQEKLSAISWNRQWMLGWRDITNVTNERTCIASMLPLSGISGINLIFPRHSTPVCAALLANLNSLVVDYIVRQKMGGTHLKALVIKQLPILPSSYYTSSILDFLVPRVLELSYTSKSLAGFAAELDYFGEPFAFDQERRQRIEAELNAFYANAYGLRKHELEFILDPKSVHGNSCPGETFRVLKNNEIRQFGEYRTRRLVLEAWDRLFGE
jgi:hypothetical protein